MVMILEITTPYYKICASMTRDYKSLLQTTLMKAGLSLNVFWQGISKPLLRETQLSCSRECTVHLFGLNFFLEILFLVTK